MGLGFPNSLLQAPESGEGSWRRGLENQGLSQCPRLGFRDTRETAPTQLPPSPLLSGLSFTQTLQFSVFDSHSPPAALTVPAPGSSCSGSLVQALPQLGVGEQVPGRPE